MLLLVFISEWCGKLFLEWLYIDEKNVLLFICIIIAWGYVDDLFLIYGHENVSNFINK